MSRALAVRIGHLHAVEQVSRRWRGGHDPAVAETRRENLIYAQIVTSACSALTTAVAITRGTGGQNRVVAALPPVLCLSYASPRSMGSQTELRQSTICSTESRLVYVLAR